MILLIDNYDSFTYNLAHLLAEAGAEVLVRRNDEISAATAAQISLSHLVFSPGPGRPAGAGALPEIARCLAGRVPTLGVCLGHQAIGIAYGARVVRVDPVHGKRSTVFHSGRGSFRDLPSPIQAARYHSLAIDRASLPPELEVTAWSPDGLLMGVAHRFHPVEGFQFHPESILTDDGEALVGAFLARVAAAVP